MRALGVLAALAVLVVAACGGSSRPKGPPDLVFVSTRDGDYALFGATAEGKHAYRLTKERGDPATAEGLFFQGEPAWSPDGERIAFVSLRDGRSHIYSMRFDGTETRRLTASRQNDEHPSWSPDGKWIVFAREGAIFRIRAGGGAARRIGKAPGSAGDPSYSPDGRFIAYDYRRPGLETRDLWVMKSDGTGARRLTDLRAVTAWPAWSPDGRQLAFQSNVHGGHPEVFTIPADGGQPKRVTASGTSTIQPAWTPDGRLSFSRDGAIWVRAGAQETRLTSTEDNDSAPAWRPK